MTRREQRGRSVGWRGMPLAWGRLGRLSVMALGWGAALGTGCSNPERLTVEPSRVRQEAWADTELIVRGVPAHRYLQAQNGNVEPVADFRVEVNGLLLEPTGFGGDGISLRFPQEPPLGLHDVRMVARGRTYWGRGALLVEGVGMADGGPDGGEGGPVDGAVPTSDAQPGDGGSDGWDGPIPGVTVCQRDGDCDDTLDCTRDLCVGNRCEHQEDHSRCAFPEESCVTGRGCTDTLWVDQSCRAESSCGPGTAAEPFATLLEAHAALQAAGTTAGLIRVRPGNYRDGTLRWEGPVTWVGLEGEEGVVWDVEGANALEASGDVALRLRSFRVLNAKVALTCRDRAQCSLGQVELRGSQDYGLLASGDAVVLLDRSVVAANQRGGARLNNVASLFVLNSFVFGNGGSAAEAGAFYLRDRAELRVINSTVADNGGGSRPGVVRAAESGSIRLLNVVLWQNGAAGLRECQRCVFGDDSLMGDVDPLFVGPSPGAAPDDYRLTADSPARDLGIFVDAVPGTDFWGTVRVEGSVDSGAHEYVP